jgi:hypothetical protein
VAKSRFNFLNGSKGKKSNKHEALAAH